MEEKVLSLFQEYAMLAIFVVVIVSERTFEVVVGRVIKPVGRLLDSRGVSTDGWYQDLTMVLSWLWVGLFVFATGFDLFEGLFEVAWAGRLLTCLAAGAGSNLLHEIFGALQGIKLWGRANGE